MLAETQPKLPLFLNIPASNGHLLPGKIPIVLSFYETTGREKRTHALKIQLLCSFYRLRDKRTIRKHIKQVRKRSGGQNWRTFLKNHAHEIWACDFTVVHTLFFKPLYVFVVMEHESRRIVHTAVTTNPRDEWTAQQIREATPWGKRPKYLIHDNDGKFGSRFKDLLKDSGIKAIKTPPKAPRANALCERFMGSLRRECTDNFLILYQHQLHRIISTYADYFNQQRPHQGIDQHIPVRFAEPTPPANYRLKGKLITTPVLNGLFHSYSYAHYFVCDICHIP